MHQGTIQIFIIMPSIKIRYYISMTRILVPSMHYSRRMVTSTIQRMKTPRIWYTKFNVHAAKLNKFLFHAMKYGEPIHTRMILRQCWRGACTDIIFSEVFTWKVQFEIVCHFHRMRFRHAFKWYR